MLRAVGVQNQQDASQVVQKAMHSIAEIHGSMAFEYTDIPKREQFLCRTISDEGIVNVQISTKLSCQSSVKSWDELSVLWSSSNIPTL